MVFFLRMLIFSLAAAVMSSSAIVLAFILNARMVPQAQIIFYSALYVFVMSALLAYPFFKLFLYLGTLQFSRKDMYGGSFARLRK